jgi:O-antigen/teichoic acid export membrane protein
MLTNTGKIINRIFRPGEAIREKAFSGMVWMYGFQILEKAIKAIQLVVFARFLSPQHIGIVSLSMIAASAVGALSQAGFRLAIIQVSDDDDDTFNTAWTLSLIRGALIYCVLYVSAPWVSMFFSIPKLVPVLRVMAVSHVLIGLQNIGVALLSRRLDFKKYSVWACSGVLSNCMISIPLAIILKNEWAIVFGIIISEVVKTIFSYVLHPYRPRLTLRRSAAKKILNFGVWIAGAKTTEYLSNQLDKIVLGKLFGVSELGIYSMSYRFVDMAKNSMGQISNVVFPSFSRIKNDNRSVVDVFLLYFNALTIFILPVFGCMYVFSASFVDFVLGKQWHMSIEPMRILMIGASIKLLMLACIPFLNAIGKPKGVFEMTLISNVSLIIALYPLGKLWGIDGIAMAWSISNIIAFPFCIRSVMKYGQIPFKDISFLFFPILGALAMVVGANYVLALSHIQVVVDHIFSMVVAMGIYLGWCYMVERCLKIPLFERLSILVHKFI